MVVNMIDQVVTCQQWVVRFVVVKSCNVTSNQVVVYMNYLSPFKMKSQSVSLDSPEIV